MEKEQLKVEARPLAVRWQIPVWTSLILAVLLAATVGVLIYGAVTPKTHPMKVAGEKLEKKVHLSNKKNHEEIDEDLEFYSKENVVVMKEEGGVINIQDYGKGLHITKDLKTGVCYVIPTKMSARDGKEMEEYLRAGNTTFQLTKVKAVKHLIPGKISDTSFLPAVTDNYCFEGYQWLTMVPESSNMQKRSLRVRRGWGWLKAAALAIEVVKCVRDECWKS